MNAPDPKFENSWDDQTRAESYSRLEFPNTYYLAYRDLPDIISRHVTGKRALDFGCGTGCENRTNILAGLRDLLKPGGKMICLDSTPELYTNEWASHSTKDFPENWSAKTGDIVRVIMLDVEDRRSVEDIYWTNPDYHKLFSSAGLTVEAIYKPLGYKHEPYKWISETQIAPWIIFVLIRTPE
jgi:hypothetical protein